MLQDAEYSTHANINRAGMQPYRYETFTAAAAGKVHRFCGIKKPPKKRCICKRAYERRRQSSAAKIGYT